MFQQGFSNTDDPSYAVQWQRYVLRKDKTSVWTFGLYFRYVKCPPWTCACRFRSYETWSNMSGEARRPWAINNFEGVDMTRHNPLDTMWSIGLPPALSRRMFSPLEILSSRKKRFMWGPECISRCLRSGSLHPAQCHQICT